MTQARMFMKQNFMTEAMAMKNYDSGSVHEIVMTEAMSIKKVWWNRELILKCKLK